MTFIGDWQILPETCELRRGAEEAVRLKPKAMEVLLYLVREHGRSVSTQELLDACWPDRVVVEAVVHNRIAELRSAMGDDAQNPTYIRTIPGQGYVAVGPFAADSDSSLAPKTERISSSGESATDSSAANRLRRHLPPVLRSTWSLTGTALIAVLALGAWLAVPLHAPTNEVNTLAVLPFVNVSPEPGNDYVSDGIRLELIQTLANIPWLRVSSATASSFFKDKKTPVATIGQELNVEYVVEGSVHVSGEKTRVYVQLTSVADGFEVWSRRYDRDHTDLFLLQSEVSRAIVGELPLLLDNERFTAAVDAGTTHPGAYDAYLRARAIRTTMQFPEDLDEAESWYRNAIELDPHFYDAHAMLAEVLLLRSNYPRGRLRVREAAALLENLEKADVNRQRKGRSGHLVLLFYLEKNWGEIEAVIGEELRKSASEAYWFTQYADLLMLSGLPKPALMYAQAAEQLEPLERHHKTETGEIYFFMGEHERAVAKMDECLLLVPNDAECKSYKAAALARLGELDQALELLAEASWRSSSTRCVFLLEAGRYCNAEDAYDATLTANVSLAVLSGDFDRAFDYLATALANDHLAVIYARQQSGGWPAAFRQDPRWKEYLQQVGLHDAWRDELCLRAQRLKPYTGLDVACSPSSEDSAEPETSA